MKRLSSIALCCGLLIGVSCRGTNQESDGGDEGENDSTDTNGDAGTGTDGSQDTSSQAVGDPCSADVSLAITTRGCNGAILGAQADGAVGGLCEVASFDCPSGVICFSWDGNCGVCAHECQTEPDKVSTGGCPSGFRCFPYVGGGGYCFADCEQDSDCSTGLCNPSTGSCGSISCP